MIPLDKTRTLALIRAALDEDFAFGPDVTSLATISPEAMTTATVVARQDGVLAGVDAIAWTLEELHGRTPRLAPAEVTVHTADATAFHTADTLATIVGPTQLILGAERTLLNIVSHATAIATHTRAWVDAIDGTGAQIRDTRKTLPGMRDLQKYAVRCGGGTNHRMGLGDAAMIKDNHVHAAGTVVRAFELLVKDFPGLPREVEVDTLEQLEQLLALKPELVLLDNFTVTETATGVALRDQMSPETKLESSGGLRLENAQEYAATGVDYLAVGALTHSVVALDIGLDFQG